MKRGRYANCYSDLSAYRSPLFKPYLKVVRDDGCCGWDAFITITGKYPKKKFGKLTTDKKMIDALVGEGLDVVPLSVCSVTNRPNLGNLVTEKHVLLISQMFRKNEGSWCVLHKGKIYHNRKDETEFFHPLEFINRPILSAY